MAAELVVEFEGGRKIYFGDKTSKGGLSEASVGANVAKASKEQFEAALGTLGHLIDAMEKSLAKVVKKPSKVAMEFGASLKGECDLWIVSGEGSSEFKVTLTWES